MKIVAVDNFNRETGTDVLVCVFPPGFKNMKMMEGIVDHLNSTYCASEHSSWYYMLKDDSYVLHRGIEDLV